MVAYDKNHSFVVGDFSGVDAVSQMVLSMLSANVTVYHMFDSPRNNFGFETMGGFTTDEERDAAMTAVSDYDIAWSRRKGSGTEKNILRRRKQETKEGESDG